jgi:hypothetical protein
MPVPEEVEKFVNRFVLVLPEAYDEYEAAVPHPVEATVGREELLAVLRG